MSQPAPVRTASPRVAHCATCEWRSSREWGVLDEEEIQLLDQAKSCHTYRPGQVIFYQGNPCVGMYDVLSGTVAIRKHDVQGSCVLVRLVHEGQSLGYRTFFSGGTYAADAEALTTCTVCFIDKDALHQVLDRNVDLRNRFLQRVAQDLEHAEEAWLRQVALPVRSRLSHLLLEMRGRFATVSPDGTLTIELPISRQDIASTLGTRAETLARTIRALADDGVAQFKGRTVTIADLDLLYDEVEAID